MSVEEEVKKAVKEGRAILGFRRSLKYIKMNEAKLVVIAKNVPEEFKEKILSATKNVKIFNGSSKELGIICGKPYPVSTVVIKG